MAKEFEAQRASRVTAEMEVSPMKYLEPFAAIGPRPTCSAQEKRAAFFVKDAMERLGLEVQEDRFNCNPRMFRPHMLLFLGVVAMGVLPVIFGAYRLGYVLAALGCLYARKLYLDLLHNKDTVLVDVLPKSPCRNVIGKIRAKGVMKNRIILLSHLDSAVCSPIFSEKMVKSLKTNILIDRILFVTLAALYAAAAATNIIWFYYGAVALSLYVVGSLLVLLYSEMFSPIAPGANDNGSGVAGVLAMAEQLSQHPLENTEVWCVALGAEEPGALGSRALWASHADELRKSYIINIDSVAAGGPRYVVNEGYTEEYKCDGEMIRILDEFAKAHPECGLTPMEFKGFGGYTDCTHLIRNGCRAITFCSTQPDGLIKNWHTMKDTIDNIEKDTYENVMKAVRHLVKSISQSA